MAVLSSRMCLAKTWLDFQTALLNYISAHLIPVDGKTPWLLASKVNGTITGMLEVGVAVCWPLCLVRTCRCACRSSS